MRLIRLLRSLRLTAILLLTLGLLFLVGLWIPQKSMLQGELYTQWRQNAPAIVGFLESAGLTEVYSAPLTLAVWALFFANLTAVMMLRVKGIVRRIKTDSANLLEPDLSGMSYRKTLKVITSEDDFYREMQQNGYHVVSARDRFLAIRNRISPAATILFHLSFYLILVGAVISNYTKFSGMVNLSEGEAFTGNLSEFSEPPRLSKIGEPPRIGFTVLKVIPEVQGVTSTSLTVTVQDEKGVSRQIGINRPYKNGATVCVIKNLGISPLMVLSADGKEIDGAYVKLNVLKGKTDQFRIGPYAVKARFYPDYEVLAGKEGTKTEEFRNPVLHLQVSKAGEPVGEGSIKQGEAVVIGRDRLEFREMPFWVSIAIVREHGLGVLYTGFTLAVIALVWRFTAYRREIIGIWWEEDSRSLISVSGRADFYPALTEEEFDQMFGTMKSVNIIG